MTDRTNANKKGKITLAPRFKILSKFD